MPNTDVCACAVGTASPNIISKASSIDISRLRIFISIPPFVSINHHYIIRAYAVLRNDFTPNYRIKGFLCRFTCKRN